MRTLAAAALALSLAGLGPARAQDWPTRTVTMVVPFPAGGPVDLVGRIVAQHLSEMLGQQVIIENIGGAGGMTGAARVAKAPPDGSVFLFGNQATHTFSQMLYKKPLYDAVNDFTPVALVVANSKILATRRTFRPTRCRSSSPMPRPTKPGSSSARPEPARRRTSPASFSTPRSG
jgi:tripartite-type tricarboxylate transporter receptor subunit TctC